MSTSFALTSRPSLAARCHRLAAFLLPWGLPAQTVPPAPTPSAAVTGETVTLSPFEVNATLDVGYVGQDTLSGSRLRTNLKDIAAAISPMTSEFLRDISATNIETAMEYGVGTRIDTDDARAAGPVGESFNDAIRSIRVRGLPGATRSVNFFDAPGEVDIYMVDRIEVSRGPNSILYGIGSPAGKINVSSKQAQVGKNAYSVTSRIDSWNGQRYTFDANLALVPNRLGVRAVVLRGREKSWRDAGHNDQDRVFLAAKWQVDRKTTVKAEFEYGGANRFVPRPFFGVDRTSSWVAAGRPLFDNFPAAAIGTSPYNYTPGAAFVAGQPGTPGTPRRDVAGSVAFGGRTYAYTDLPGVFERTTADLIVVSDRFSTAQNYRNFTTSEFISGSLFANDFAMGRANPRAALEANWAGGHFVTRTASIFIQRELLPDLNAELAFNRTQRRQETRNVATWPFFGVTADTNMYLPTGQLKPADMLYHIDISGDYRPERSDTDQGRLSLSWEKNLHPQLTVRLAGLGEFSTNKNRAEFMQQYWLNGPELSSGGAFSPSPENAANQVIHRYYIADIRDTYRSSFRIPARYDLSGPTRYTDPRTGAVRTIYATYINRNQGNTSTFNRDTSAGMFVGQAFLLKNRLIGTFGYRSDRLRTRIGLAYRDPVGEAVAPNTGVWLPADPKTAPLAVFSGETKTAGAVGHVTSWLSVFYNRSTSLSTPGTNFITPKNPTQTTTADYAQQPSGQTDDYGIKLSLWRDRIFVTATKYHTVSKNEFGFSGFNKNNVVRIWEALANSGALSAEETTMARRQAEVTNQILGYMQDSESQGLEFELVGRILPEWSVSANYSRNDTKRSRLALEYRAYIDHWKPFWKKYADFAIAQNVNTPGAEKVVSMVDWRTPAEIATTGDVTVNTDSINEAIADTEALFFDNPHAFEGKRFVGDPLHNLNLRTRYDFRTGLLKGFSLGSGVRIRQGRIAGARTDYTYAQGSDLTDVWNGRVTDKVTLIQAKDQNVYDLQVGYTRVLGQKRIRWDVQLNVNNVTNQRELIVNNINGRTLQPLTYRYQDPRQFILTNTFKF